MPVIVNLITYAESINDSEKWGNSTQFNKLLTIMANICTIFNDKQTISREVNIENNPTFVGLLINIITKMFKIPLTLFLFQLKLNLIFLSLHLLSFGQHLAIFVPHLQKFLYLLIRP